MAFKNEDLRLSLSLPSSQNCFPLELIMFPSSMPHSKINYIEEDPEQCSPTSISPSLCGKRTERDDKENEDGQNSQKKLKMSKEQTMVLEESFKEHNTLNNEEKGALAKQLSLSPRQVEVWFQNRRARTKLKQTEVECEYLKRWCQKLAEENKRLQNEIGKLRSLNSVSSPTALNMYPSIESIKTPQSELLSG